MLHLLLELRKEKEVVSDARLEDFDKLTAAYNSPKLDDRHMIKVDTDQSFSDSIDQLYTQLIDSHLGNM